MSHLQLPHRRPAHAHYLRNMAKLASRPARWPKNPRQDPACLLCALQHFLSRPLSPENKYAGNYLRTRPRPSRAGECPPGHSPAAVSEHQPSERHGRGENRRVRENEEGIGKGPVREAEGGGARARCRIIIWHDFVLELRNTQSSEMAWWVCGWRVPR